jgi:hypothetical protein
MPIHLQSFMSATHVFNLVTAFFAQRSGFGSLPRAADMKGSLLRTACVGNPERTIQGELLAYLKSRDQNAVLEYRLHSFASSLGGFWKNGRSVDIMVLDDDFARVCAIELKHYSRVQSSLQPLLSFLEQDRRKYEGVDVPLIQVGVYTELDCLPDGPRESFEAFRFISCYAYDRNGDLRKWRTGYDATTEVGYAALEEWAQRTCSIYAHEFHGSAEQFDTPNGPVSGRVHYFVGLAKESTAACSMGRRVTTYNEIGL